jgi:hypothetical protein
MSDSAMNLASPKQLDIIDKLRGLGISNFVGLPQVRDASSMEFHADIEFEQLAVVGDQSRYSCLGSKDSLLTAVVARALS